MSLDVIIFYVCVVALSLIALAPLIHAICQERRRDK